MSTQFPFNGQIIKIPGSYSNIKSGVKNPSISLPYGNVIIIDSGSGAGYGGGAGIDGTLSKGKDSHYEFDNIGDFQNFVKGGLYWLLANPLFRPAGLGINGVSKITYIKAATTVPAEITFNFQLGDDLVIQVTDEGLIGNGLLVNSNLTYGYAAKLIAGRIDPTKFIMVFYRGTYKGLDQNNLPYDGISAANSVPLMVAKSPEFVDLVDLIAWMNTDATFLKSFKLKTIDESTSANGGNGLVNSTDLTNYTSYNVASGGTETYASSTLLDSVLTSATDLNVSFILADNYGDNSRSDNNVKLQNFAVIDSKFKPELYIGGGNSVNDFITNSIDTAKFFNDDSVTIVHGGIKKNSQLGIRTYNSIYKAAAVMAREAGVEPQVPISFKSIDIDGEVHQLNDKEIEQALDAGVVTTRNENGSFDITKGINSLQNNNFLLNPDGTTPSKQVKRIGRQINKDIITASREELFKQNAGPNRNTLSEDDVKSWLTGFLKKKIATSTVDNLILSFQDIVVQRQNDAYYVSYKIVENTEINFLFFTAVVIGI